MLMFDSKNPDKCVQAEDALRVHNVSIIRFEFHARVKLTLG